jgi:hypothetical protein
MMNILYYGHLLESQIRILPILIKARKPWNIDKKITSIILFGDEWFSFILTIHQKKQTFPAA